MGVDRSMRGHAIMGREVLKKFDRYFLLDRIAQGGMAVGAGVAVNAATFNTEMWSEVHTGQAHEHSKS